MPNLNNYGTVTPATTDAFLIVQNTGGTPAWATKLALGSSVISMAAQGAFQAKNNDATGMSVGMPVVFDSSGTTCVKKATRYADSAVIGVCLSGTIAAGGTGTFITTGINTVNTSGTVVLGNWLVTSATTGYAQDSGLSMKPGLGGIGMAMSSAGAGFNTVQALLSVQPSTSSGGLRQMTTTSTGTGATPLTISHLVDSGTDLLVVRALTSAAATSAITWNGGTLTKVDEQASGTYYASIWYLKSPTVGTYNVVITSAGSTIGGICTNYQNSLVSPFRAASKGNFTGQTSISQTPTSAVGDIVLDIAGIWAQTWAAGTGQTAEGTRAVSSYNMVTSYKTGAAGSTAMSWSGTSTNGAMVSAAIAGS